MKKQFQNKRNINLPKLNNSTSNEITTNLDVANDIRAKELPIVAHFQKPPQIDFTENIIPLLIDFTLLFIYIIAPVLLLFIYLLISLIYFPLAFISSFSYSLILFYHGLGWIARGKLRFLG